MAPAEQGDRDLKENIVPVSNSSPSNAGSPSRKLRGRLEDVLTGYAIRLRSPCSTGAEFYVAPRHEVGEAVLAEAIANPYLSPAEPGFRAPGSHVNVCFEPAGPCGGSIGECRAQAVQLVVERQLDFTNCTHEASVSSTLLPQVFEEPASGENAPLGHYNELKCKPLRAAMYAAGLRAVSLMAQVLNDWRSNCSAEAMSERICTLDAEAQHSLEKGDGERLCGVLLRAVGGLSPPGATFALSMAHELDRSALCTAERQDYERAQVDLRKMQEHQLLKIVVSCLSNLDLEYNAIRARVQPALRYLESLLEDVIGGACAANVGRLQWRKIQACVTLYLQSLPERVARSRRPISRMRRLNGALFALRPAEARASKPSRSCVKPSNQLVSDTLRRTRRKVAVKKPVQSVAKLPRALQRDQCTVVGCCTTGSSSVVLEDVFGPPGLRCIKHGARQCSVMNCKRLSCARMVVADEHGPPGRRCHLHGRAVARCCNVPGCTRQPRNRIASADQFGAAGLRCRTHGGGRCNVAGCQQRAWGSVTRDDEQGPSGQRCYSHGGKTCVVHGCGRRPVQRKPSPDSWGSEGWRCKRHATLRVPQIVKG